MKIGIVSKDEHIKTHVKALKRDGYDVVGLGSSPSEIPTSVDLVVLRIDSCSHNGSDTAYAWTRTTGKPLIVENGLFGIRHKLKVYDLAQRLGARSDAKSLLYDLSYSTNSPLKSKEVSMPKVVSPTPKKFSRMAYVLPPEAPKGTFEFQRGIPYSRIKKTFPEALSLYYTLSDETLQRILDGYQSAANSGKGTFFPRLEELAPMHATGIEYDKIRSLMGNPIKFFMLLSMIVPIPERSKKNLIQAYRDFIGRGCDFRVADYALWATSQIAGSSEGDPICVESAPKISEDFTEAPFVAEVEKPLEAEMLPAPQEVETKTTEAPIKDFVALLPKDDVFKSFRSDFEDFILDSADKDAQILKKTEALSTEVTALRSENLELREEVSSLKKEMESKFDDLKKLFQSFESVLVETQRSIQTLRSGANSVDLLESLDALKKRGATVQISMGPSERSSR